MQRLYLGLTIPAIFLLVHQAGSYDFSIALVILGVLLGLAFNHSGFGFTGAYRRMMETGEVRLVRAQLLLFALTTVLFAPFLAAGSFNGQELAGAVVSPGVSIAVGAFLFGIGMQLAGGCGSGTLCGLGSGSSRLFIALITFCFGGWLATLHFGWWAAQPSWDVPALGEMLGWPQAVALQLALLGGLWWMARRWGSDNAQPPQQQTYALLRGPWPLFVGMMLVALLNLGVLLETGHPWSITWAFTLWGAKMAMRLDWDPQSSDFWGDEDRLAMLHDSVFADETSVMDMAIILGSVMATTLAGRFSLNWRMDWKTLSAALLGGLLMGYGARIAYGCNIGALLSGISSTSLHGWLWLATALPGNWVGIRLRRAWRIG